jgi:polar amino acid transport system substrate-binding protein
LSRIARFPRIVLLVPLVMAGCDLPKDPAGTTERVLSTRVLRAGASENPPWVRFNGAEVVGIEADLVRAFAGQMGAQVEWVRNGETPLLEALEKRELDVVAGGITSRSPWTSRLGTTQTYLKAKKVVAMPAGSAEPASLNGLAVQVAPGEASADRLRREGARPVSSIGPAAPTTRLVYEWEAQARGLTRTRFYTSEDKHVLVAAPGENQLLLRLDRFLAEARPLLAEALDREARR